MLTVDAAQAEDILFGSTSASSSHYGYIDTVGKLINESGADINATVVETGAAMDNIRRMQRGQMDLGIITTNVVQHVVAGTNEFEATRRSSSCSGSMRPRPKT